MARIRSVKPEFFKHEGLGSQTTAHRLLFIGLWCLADRDGRLQDRPRRIKAEVFPYDDEIDIEALLNDLAKHAEKFIIRYAVDGERYIQVSNFHLHQRPHPKEPASVFPKPRTVLAVPSAPHDTGKAKRVPSVYFIQAGDEGSIKIGWARNVQVRLSALQVATAVPLRLLCTIPGDPSKERELHEQFKDAHLTGEWYRPCQELLDLISRENSRPAVEKHGATMSDQPLRVILDYKTGKEILDIGNGAMAQPSLLLEDVVARWNGIPGAVQAEEITGPIRQTIVRRLKEHPDPGWWDDLFQRIARSDFLCGRKTDFAATLDWCLGPKNLAKILNGNYENRVPVLVSQQASGIHKFLSKGGDA